MEWSIRKTLRGACLLLAVLPGLLHAGIVSYDYIGLPYAPPFGVTAGSYTSTDFFSGSVTLDDSFLDPAGDGDLIASKGSPVAHLLSALFRGRSAGPALDLSANDYTVNIQFVAHMPVVWEIHFSDPGFSPITPGLYTSGLSLPASPLGYGVNAVNCSDPADPGSCGPDSALLLSTLSPPGIWRTAGTGEAPIAPSALLLLIGLALIDRIKRPA